MAEAGFRHRPSIQIEPIEIVVTETWVFARRRLDGAVVIHPTGEVVTVDGSRLRFTGARPPEGGGSCG